MGLKRMSPDEDLKKRKDPPGLPKERRDANEPMNPGPAWIMQISIKVLPGSEKLVDNPELD